MPSIWELGPPALATNKIKGFEFDIPEMTLLGGLVDPNTRGQKAKCKQATTNGISRRHLTRNHKTRLYIQKYISQYRSVTIPDSHPMRLRSRNAPKPQYKTILRVPDSPNTETDRYVHPSCPFNNTC